MSQGSSPPGGGTAMQRFRHAYAGHRAAEGRGAGGPAELLALPYLRTGGHARSWAVRARTFDAFLDVVVAPLADAAGTRPLRVLDAGAGNGWLSYRLARMGHVCVALDVRHDAVDGLGAAAGYAPHLASMFARLAASFEALPLRDAVFDLVTFNASLHYASSLSRVLSQAVRTVRPGGRLAVLDSPFYAREEDGAAMVAEKQAGAAVVFGERAHDLLALPCAEFLTRARLERGSEGSGLDWHRHRVRYPMRYEARPVVAALLRRRPPSRFDLWETVVP